MTPRAPAVSHIARIASSLMGASFATSLFASVPEELFNFILRLMSRSRASTPKTPAPAKAPGIEPSAPIPDLNRRCEVRIPPGLAYLNSCPAATAAQAWPLSAGLALCAPGSISWRIQQSSGGPADIVKWVLGDRA